MSWSVIIFGKVRSKVRKVVSVSLCSEIYKKCVSQEYKIMSFVFLLYSVKR